ncbi:MAG TPA: nucleotide disphospho-sugar-binding domain-containing protein [Actinomycetota bacterium]|nr:nucleotide disphospho-sugar-binding domain-containing protein [Actinomycetota bacterium]
MLGSFTHGLPQLVLPVVPPGAATEESIADAVNRLLEESSFRTDACRLRDEIAAMPSPAEVVTKLAILLHS